MSWVGVTSWKRSLAIILFTLLIGGGQMAFFRPYRMDDRVGQWLIVNFHISAIIVFFVIFFHYGYQRIILDTKMNGFMSFIFSVILFLAMIGMSVLSFARSNGLEGILLQASMFAWSFSMSLLAILVIVDVFSFIGSLFIRNQSNSSANGVKADGKPHRSGNSNLKQQFKMFACIAVAVLITTAGHMTALEGPRLEKIGKKKKNKKRICEEWKI